MAYGDERWASALHEVGHLVINHLLGGRSERCQIHADGSGETHLEFPVPSGLSAERTAWFALVIAVADASPDTFTDHRSRLLSWSAPPAWREELSRPVLGVVAILRAGAIAELLVPGASPDPERDDEDPSDRNKIAVIVAAAAAVLDPETSDAWTAWTEEQLWHQHHDAVVHIAQELVVVGSIEESEIANLLGISPTPAPVPLPTASGVAQPLGTLATIGLGLGMGIGLAMLIDAVTDDA